MGAPDAALLTALLVVAVLVLARWHDFRAKGAFCAGPSNLGLYDHPYYYPVEIAREALAWDRSHRCAAYCGTGDCAVWCR